MTALFFAGGRFPGGIPTNEQLLEKEGEEEPSSVSRRPL